MARDSEDDEAPRRTRRVGPDDEKKRERVDVRFDTTNEVIVMVAAAINAAVAKRLSSITTDYFKTGNHPRIWNGILELGRRGLEYSRDTLATLVGDEDAATLDAYIADRPGEQKNLSHHVEQLRWDKCRYDVAVGPLPEFIEAIKDPTTDPARTKQLSKKMHDALVVGDLKFLRDAKSVAAEHEAELERRMNGEAVYEYGFKGLDFYGPDDYRVVKKRGGGTERECLDGRHRMLPGPAPRQVTVVTGLSGSGKSTTTAISVLHWTGWRPVRDENKLIVRYEQTGKRRKVLWGAWENDPGYSLETVALMSLGYSRTDILEGRFTPGELRIVRERMEEFQDTLRFFSLPFGTERGAKADKFEKLNEKHLDLVHQYVDDSGCDVFVADLFRRVLREMKPDDEEQALYRMQAIAKATKTHAFIIQQLRLKDVEQRKDKRPTREGVKGTGAYVEIADTLIGWHREKAVGHEDNGKAECHVLKQRYAPGDQQVVEFDVDLEFGVLENGRTVVIAREGAGSDSEMDDFLSQTGTMRRQRGVGRAGR